MCTAHERLSSSMAATRRRAVNLGAARDHVACRRRNGANREAQVLGILAGHFWWPFGARAARLRARGAKSDLHCCVQITASRRARGRRARLSVLCVVCSRARHDRASPGLKKEPSQPPRTPRRRPWQYLVLHLEHCLARRSSGAAQAAQVVMIILVCMRSLVGPIGSVMQFSLEKTRANAVRWAGEREGYG